MDPTKVLLIEDNRMDVRLVTEALAEVGRSQYQLKAAGRLDEGLKYLAEAHYDVVLLDLFLPDEAGLETIHRVCAEQPNVPVVILTGFDDQSLALRALHEGAEDFLVKGELSGQLLARTMRYSIERKRAELERKRLELQLQHAQKLESLGVLAGGIAHDFNNLLTGILGNAALALMDLWPETPARRHVEQVEKAARRAAELTSQMLAYAGRTRPVVKPLSMATLVQDMAELLGTVVSKKATLHCDFQADPLIDGDAAQLQQVVMNLITNASDALEDRAGSITLRVGVLQADRAYLSGCYLLDDLPEGQYAFVEIVDTGKGMDPATQEKIFEPFFSTKFAGRGLGLASVLGIVRGHHGTIRVCSQPGQGTTFTVLLPYHHLSVRPGAAPRPAGGTAGASGAGRTILVVDDEEYMRTMVKRILEKSGYSVQTAREGREALRRFREQPSIFDAVVLDMTMPMMNGEEVYAELLRMRAPVRVLFCSGYSHQQAEQRLSGSTIDFLQKPYDPDTLLERLTQLLQRPLDPPGAQPTA